MRIVKTHEVASVYAQIGHQLVRLDYSMRYAPLNARVSHTICTPLERKIQTCMHSSALSLLQSQMVRVI